MINKYRQIPGKSQLPRYWLVLCLSLFQATGIFAQTASIIRYDSIHHPVTARSAMVVSQNELASSIGAQILEQGGNAVDAAVAVGFALAVTLPRAGNIGGSGFMLIHRGETGDTVALDFRSAAPMQARLEDYLDANGVISYQDMTFGPKAAAIPGTVAGLEAAWQRYGSMPWPELLAPAHELATECIVVTEELAYALSEAMSVMRVYPSSMAVYAQDGTDAFESGALFKQPDLAWSLQQIRNHGAAAFYQGELAQRLINGVQQAGGYFSQEDFDNYQVRERPVISTNYRGFEVVTMPPTSVGGPALLQMLNVLSEFKLSSYPQGSATSLHLLAEVMKRANANRRFGIGDPDFTELPMGGLLSRALARQLAEGIDLKQATPTSSISAIDPMPFQSRDTTHYSIVDGEGNAVSTTYTLGFSFGSGYVVEGTGILLDNQIRNFYHNQPDHPNFMAPGKRVVSTMTPTMVFDEEGELFMVTGTPGGSRIHTSILQLIVNVIDYGMNIAEATHAPRIYQGWISPKLGMEKGISIDSQGLLEDMGHDIQLQQTMGSTQSIMIIDGILTGAADPRRPGASVAGIDITQ